jgi:hypothetical protein
MDCLLFICGRIFVCQQPKEGGNSSCKLRNANIPIKPPSGILPPEQDHEERRQEDDATCNKWKCTQMMMVRPAAPVRTTDEKENAKDWQDEDDAKRRDQPIETFWIVNVEGDRV